MTKIRYIGKNFKSDSEDVINKANDILSEYRDDGYTLTLRQLYYQFVARDFIPNTERYYKRIGSIVSDARLAGLISWTAIEDRGRTCHAPYIQDDETSALKGIEYGYAPDLWANQPNYVEIWIEKDALVNVIERPADKYDVPYLACKGYLSSSEAWRAGQRYSEAMSNGKNCYLIHLGNHDPSEIDMTRDNNDRLNLFVGNEVEVRRIALNMDQVDEYSPPPNPAKITDSRAADYIDRYGPTSWELDALEPSVIADLVEAEIKDIIDQYLFDATINDRDLTRQRLEWIGDNAHTVLDFAQANIEGDPDDR